MKIVRTAFLYLFLYVVLPLAVLEVAVRLLGSADHLYTDGGAYENAANGAYWRYRPGFTGTVPGPTVVRIGPHGSRLHRPAGQGNGVLVAVFGDSFTFGQGVADEDTFAARLERDLRAASLDARVLNFGVAGHSLDMEVAHLADRMGDVHPQVVVLAFPTVDLDPRRARNHVDRFGYLTKNTFGSSGYLRDVMRAALRNSRLALLTKQIYLRLWPGRAPVAASREEYEARLAGSLDRFRATMKRFDTITREVGRIVVCLDMRETPLSKRIRRLMIDEFPRITYVHAPPAFASADLDDLQVPLDGHPNAIAHGMYADILRAPLRAAVREAVAAAQRARARRPATASTRWRRS